MGHSFGRGVTCTQNRRTDYVLFINSRGKFLDSSFTARTHAHEHYRWLSVLSCSAAQAVLIHVFTESKGVGFVSRGSWVAAGGESNAGCRFGIE